MYVKRYGVFTLLLVVAAGLIRYFSANANWVEDKYANGIYPAISTGLKYAVGWVPFSVGDLLYLLLLTWLVIQIFKSTKLVWTKQLKRADVSRKLIKLLFFSLLIYVVFNLLWGLNYNRKGIAAQLNMELRPYNRQELLALDSLLLQKVNAYKKQSAHWQQGKQTNAALFADAASAYSVIAQEYPFLKYQPVSVKPSLFGVLGNYMGFIGYYNPFTGEAQLNTTVPDVLHPYTACHEIAHQLGYAKENEANFVGYLAAANAGNPRFRYSVYLDLFLYAQRNLFIADSAAAKYRYRQLDTLVKKDITDLRKFSEQYRNPVEPFFRWVYGMYLQGNNQPMGVLTYDEVTGFLVAYHKKFGKL
ncbi:MAG: hypothetical protein RL172_2603 [Bacteroidota bacterium]|jgi:hypothetical protein